MSWKHELERLYTAAVARDPFVLTPAIRAWFAMNADANRGVEITAERRAQVADAVAREGYIEAFDRWDLHTDAYGWRILMQPIRIDAGEDLMILARVTRKTPRTTAAESHLERMLAHVGGTFSDCLMTLAPPDAPVVDVIYLWPAARRAQERAS